MGNFQNEDRDNTKSYLSFATTDECHHPLKPTYHKTRKKEFTVFEPSLDNSVPGSRSTPFKIIGAFCMLQIKVGNGRSFLENSIRLGQYFVLEGSVAFEPLPRPCFLLILLIRVA